MTDAKRLGKYAVRKAGRALTITLPAEWVLDHNVNLLEDMNLSIRTYGILAIMLAILYGIAITIGL